MVPAQDGNATEVQQLLPIFHEHELVEIPGRPSVCHGTRSRVRAVFWRPLGRLVARKDVNLCREDITVDLAATLSILRRIRAYQNDNNKNVTPKSTCTTHTTDPEDAIGEDTASVLVTYHAYQIRDAHHFSWLLDWAGVSLAEWLPQQADHRVHETTARRLARALTTALHILHVELSLVHGDVSWRNVLVEAGPPLRFRLGDLEGCQAIRGAECNNKNKNSNAHTSDGNGSSSSGALLFRPPEALLGEEPVPPSQAADVWGLGLIIAISLSGGDFPFLRNPTTATPWQLLEALAAARATPQALAIRKLCPRLSTAGVEWLVECLAWEANERSITTELLEHAWLAGESEYHPTQERDE